MSELLAQALGGRPTLHCLASQLVHAVVVGGMEDVLFLGRLNHPDVAELIDKEAGKCEYNALQTKHRLSSLTQVP